MDVKRSNERLKMRLSKPEFLVEVLCSIKENEKKGGAAK